MKIVSKSEIPGGRASRNTELQDALRGLGDEDAISISVQESGGRKLSSLRTSFQHAGNRLREIENWAFRVKTKIRDDVLYVWKEPVKPAAD